MKNYIDNDYAINKNAKGIVYRFADLTLEITLEDYLRENPDKTETDFAELKALSDSNYLEQDRCDYRQTRKNIPFYDLGESKTCASPSPEDEVIEQSIKQLEQVEIRKQRMLVKQALDKFTDIQRRRYLLYHVHGITTRKIATIEGVKHQSIIECLAWAEKKIKKFLNNA